MGSNPNSERNKIIIRFGILGVVLEGKELQAVSRKQN